MADIKLLTPIKAIRAKCLDCCCGQYKEIRLCPITSCSLHPYRLGKRPKKIEVNINIQEEQEN